VLRYIGELVYCKVPVDVIFSTLFPAFTKVIVLGPQRMKELVPAEIVDTDPLPPNRTPF
jgi:hypothetical protein